MRYFKRNAALGHESCPLAVALERSNCNALIDDNGCLNIYAKHVDFLMKKGEDIAILPLLDWPGI